jgi:hypothetical protein
MTGFDSKRAAAADKVQENAPLYASDYERGFIDGMQKQAQSSVDKAVNRMAQPAQNWKTLPKKDASLVEWANEQTPPKRPWVGLTDEEIDAIYWQHENHCGEYKVSIWPYERAIESKLKEKNA